MDSNSRYEKRCALCSALDASVTVISPERFRRDHAPASALNKTSARCSVGEASRTSKFRGHRAGALAVFEVMGFNFYAVRARQNARSPQAAVLDPLQGSDAILSLLYLLVANR